MRMMWDYNAPTHLHPKGHLPNFLENGEVCKKENLPLVQEQVSVKDEAIT